jgi:alpha-beta hydrolase superfamily lysophospholipase
VKELSYDFSAFRGSLRNLAAFTRAVFVLLLLLDATRQAKGDDLLPPRRDTITVDALPLALWSRQPANPRRTILLIHGSTWSARPVFDLEIPGQQRSVLAALSARGFAAYALDLPGYGATPRTESGWLDLAEADRDIQAVLRWIAEKNPNLAKPALLGWSKGAGIVQFVAQNNPSLISSLILFGDVYDPDLVDHFGDTPEPTGPAPNVPNSAQLATRHFITKEAFDDTLVKGFVEAGLKADPVHAEWHDLAQWRALDPQKVTVPTLVIQESQDPNIKPDAEARLFTRLATRDKQWVVLPNGDHVAMIEDTKDRFIAAVTAFVERPR